MTMPLEPANGVLPPSGHVKTSAPLSVVKMTIVFWSSPWSLSHCITTPTLQIDPDASFSFLAVAVYAAVRPHVAIEEGDRLACRGRIFYPSLTALGLMAVIPIRK